MAEDPLRVFVVWHPDSGAAASLADAAFRHLCADPEFPAVRRPGVPVRYRTTSDADRVPGPVPFGDAEHTCAVVIVDDAFAADASWRSYGSELVASASAGDLVLPVALTDVGNLPPALAALEAIKLQDLEPAPRQVELLNRLTQDLAELLEPGAGRVRVFLSHAKADGLGIAETVRTHLNTAARLDHFFDARDIPDGSRFADVLKGQAGSAPVLLAIHTDTYASREWCRLEVLEAKRHQVPIAVLAAVQTGEVRSFPYIGNVPVVRWSDASCLPRVVGALVLEALRTRFFPKKVRSLCAVHGIDPEHQVFAYPPELMTAVVHREEAARDGRTLGRYLYPDPPLGREEVELIRSLDANLDPVTPTMLCGL